METNETEEQKKIALAVLTEKHKNGGVEEIHKQMFFKLGKSKCDVCDLPAAMWLQKRAIEMEATSDLFMVSVDKLSGAHAKSYNPKDAPPPVQFKCRTCGKIESVNYDATIEHERIKGSPAPRKVSDPYECSECWWNRVGSKI
jgi:predicted RNA-binding Zn-ribbon protein involved in translation (DUF1610 family)